MKIKTRVVLAGIATYVPGLLRRARVGTGGTSSVRYCYSVWLRHLVMAGRNGLPTDARVVAELGPGDSLGTGLAAVLSGAEKYYALDVVRHAESGRNLAALEELVGLFRTRARIPGDDEFPEAKPPLESYEFPAQILTEARLGAALAPERIEAVRGALCAADSVEPPGRGGIEIRYLVPWHESGVIRAGAVDMIWSQAVLEYVEALGHAYRALHSWLRPGGFMSHQIDFRCDGMAEEWNGHWGYSDVVWYLANRTRAYRLNRQPHSVHVALQRESGFRIVSDMRFEDLSGIRRERLARRLRAASETDLVTSGAFIQAVKEDRI